MDKELRNYTRKRLATNNLFINFFKGLSITNWVIIINFLIYIFIFIFLQIFGDEKVIILIALQANGFFIGKVWTVFTSMFAHIHVWHILANMVSLFFIGNFVERVIGRKRFFWFYIISGALAGLFYVVLSYFFGTGLIGERVFGNPETFAVGASGAIFALLGLLAVLTPKSKIYLIVGPIIAIVAEALIHFFVDSTPIFSMIDILLNIYILFSIFSIFSFNLFLRKIALPIKMPFWLLPIIAIVPLFIIGLFVSLPIGNTAHLGGLIVGLVFGFYIIRKYRRKTEMIRRLFRE